MVVELVHVIKDMLYADTDSVVNPDVISRSVKITENASSEAEVISVEKIMEIIKYFYLCLIIVIWFAQITTTYLFFKKSH